MLMIHDKCRLFLANNQGHLKMIIYWLRSCLNEFVGGGWEKHGCSVVGSQCVWEGTGEGAHVPTLRGNGQFSLLGS